MAASLRGRFGAPSEVTLRARRRRDSATVGLVPSEVATLVRPVNPGAGHVISRGGQSFGGMDSSSSSSSSSPLKTLTIEPRPHGYELALSVSDFEGQASVP